MTSLEEQIQSRSALKARLQSVVNDLCRAMHTGNAKAAKEALLQLSPEEKGAAFSEYYQPPPDLGLGNAATWRILDVLGEAMKSSQPRLGKLIDRLPPEAQLQKRLAAKKQGKAALEKYEETLDAVLAETGISPSTKPDLMFTSVIRQDEELLHALSARGWTIGVSCAAMLVKRAVELRSKNPPPSVEGFEKWLRPCEEVEARAMLAVAAAAGGERALSQRLLLALPEDWQHLAIQRMTKAPSRASGDASHVLRGLISHAFVDMASNPKLAPVICAAVRGHKTFGVLSQQIEQKALESAVPQGHLLPKARI